MTNNPQDKNKFTPNNNKNNLEVTNINNNFQAQNHLEANRYPNHSYNGNYKDNENNVNRNNTIDKNNIVNNDYMLNVNNNNTMSNNTNTQNKNNNNKPDRIIQIIMKIKSCPDTSAIISQLFGEDVLKRIISSDAEVEMINDLEQIISEIEVLKANNNINNNQIKDYNLTDEKENIHNPPNQRIYNNKTNDNKNENYLNAPLQKEKNFLNNNKHNLYEYSKNINKSNSKSNPTNYYENNIDNNNYDINNNVNYNKRNHLTTKDSSNKRIDYNTNPNSNNNNNNFDSLSKHSNEFISENNLMKIPGSKSIRNLNKSQSKVMLDEYKEERCENPNFESNLRNYRGSNNYNSKIFKNYTKKTSGFFDATLQQGGVSKLEYDSRKKRSKSNARGIDKNSVLGKSAEKSLIDKSYTTIKKPNSYINYRENYQEILGRKEYEFNYE